MGTGDLIAAHERGRRPLQGGAGCVSPLEILGFTVVDAAGAPATMSAAANAAIAAGRPSLLKHGLAAELYSYRPSNLGFEPGDRLIPE